MILEAEGGAKIAAKLFIPVGRPPEESSRDRAVNEEKWIMSCISRDQAYTLLTEHLKTPNLIKHCLATEAIMRSLAGRFDRDPEIWGLAGLLHDIDLEVIDADMATHAAKGAEMLREAGVSDEICEAVMKHNAEGLGLKREGVFDHALAAAETITGLIVATALVLPDKKLASVKSKSVRKRMKEKSFARGARREVIMECEEIGIPLAEFIEISLESMRGVAEEIGL